MYLVFDNNVLISASLIKGSIPDLALDKAKKEAIILSSKETIRELSTTLLRKKFEKYVNIETRLEFIIEYEDMSQLIKVADNIDICRDPKDNMYLELALSGKADFIISGDKDLLVLDPFRSIRVISPKEFLDQY